MARIVLFSLVTLFFIGCNSKGLDKATEKIFDVEWEFNRAVKKYGIKEAFLLFAADSAVVVRGNVVYKGHDEIAKYFDSFPYTDVVLTWEPFHVEVSESSDMAYTYGIYVLSGTDSIDQKVSFKGIFHTVWRLQEDGSWKFVYD